MTAQIIDGKAIAKQKQGKIQSIILNHVASGKRAPGLAVILVGDDPASQIYVQNKHIACQQVGIQSHQYILPATVSEKELIDLIKTLNENPTIDGILIQLPLPLHIHTNTILECIDPAKDVDGFHPYNLGRLAQRQPTFRPCTPYGVMEILKFISLDLRGLQTTVVGTSLIVGCPMVLELMMAECTITVCDRHTRQLQHAVSQADLLISAVGKAHLIPGHWVKSGATVIDIGIVQLNNGKLVGDVDFDIAKEKAAWITPVPGGVGPMTVAMLLQNTVTAWQNQ